MDPHRWAKIESLYHSALEKEPGERPGYLARLALKMWNFSVKLSRC